MKIGVLALQGDFGLHARALATRAGARPWRCASPSELDDIDGLIIPGGESTTLLKLMDAWGFVPALEKFHAGGKPDLRDLRRADPPGARGRESRAVLARADRRDRGAQRLRPPARVVRGPTGRPTLDGAARAARDGVHPRAAHPAGRRGVQTLARHGDEPVMARQGSVLVATFHPELTDDAAVHRVLLPHGAPGERDDDLPRLLRRCSGRRGGRASWTASELGRLVTVGADGTPHLGLYPFVYEPGLFDLHLVRLRRAGG